MSDSPSLLQSLKRFRFKKQYQNEKDEGTSAEDANSTTNHVEDVVNNKISEDENDKFCQQKNKRLLSSESDEMNISEVIKVKNNKRRILLSDSENEENSADSDKELGIKKKKRLKTNEVIALTSSDDDVEFVSETSSCKVGKESKYFSKQKNSKGKLKSTASRNRYRISSDTSTNGVIYDCLSTSDEEDNPKNDLSKNMIQPNDFLSESDNNSKESKTSVVTDELRDKTSKKKHVADKLSSNDETDASAQFNIPIEDSSNTNEKKKKKKKKKKDVEPHVYDSDADSDEEISDKMTGIKIKVFDFINTASLEEFKEVKITLKKIKLVIEERPFKGWRHLVKSCEDNRCADILNATQDLLTAREVLTDLMDRSQKIAKKTEKAIKLGSNDIVTQPLSLNPSFQLKSYQMVGLNWLAVIHKQNISGILADEMGLGKTIQIIAFLAYLKERGLTEVNRPHLIVVPASTLDNWSNEFAKWCPSLNVVQYYGNQEERRLLRHEWIRHGCNDIDVILSTYQIISGTYEDKKLFRVISIHYAIFDEGHMLKNMNTQRYDNLDKINADRKILLTGTPIQNNLLELMSLLMFVMPNMFATKKDFIKYLFQRKSKQAEEQVKFDRDNVENAKKVMMPFMLRRLKSDVLQDLPTKTTVMLECPMAKSQALKYEELLEEFKKSASNPNVEEKRSHMAMYTELRKMANHPLTMRYLFSENQISKMATLLSTDYNYKENDADRIFEDLLFMSDHELHQLSVSYKCLKTFALPDEVFLESGKFAKLDELLPDLKANNHRLLIFSQFIFLLNLIEKYLEIRGYTFLRFDGSTPVNERQELIDLYNKDDQIFVFLLTTKAGGMGINLTAADTVIINDVDYNPYNDKQAEDRCHRMGQTRDVTIIRFISKDTIEETIYRIAQEKTNLGKEVTTLNDEKEEQKGMASLLHSILGIKEV